MTRKKFTLIELLVSKTCQICVSLLFYLKNFLIFATTLLRPAGYGGQDWSKITPLFLKEKGGAGERENFFYSVDRRRKGTRNQNLRYTY